MRITNQMMAGNVLTNLNSLREKQADLTSQLSSGYRITKSSDDPSAGADVMRVQSRLQVMKQWDSNRGDAQDWLGQTENALSEMSGILNRARELTMTAANGTLTKENMQSLAPGADQLVQDMLAAFNEKQPDGALFGGFKTDADPFALDLTTGAVTYSGDSGDMQRDVGPGITVTANLHGGRLGDWTGPNNMLTAVWNLAQGLKNGDVNAVRNTLGTLDTALSSVIALRSEVGARGQRLEQVESQMKDTELRLNGVLEKAQGVDMEKAITELTSAETTYRAALQVGARVIPTSLADFLR